MEQNILGKTPEAFEKELKKHRGNCVLVACAALALNLVFTLLRNDSNHWLMLVCNIAVDVLAGWFLLGYIGCYVNPKVKALKIFHRNQTQHRGRAVAVAPETQRIQGLDCRKLTMEDGRTLFLPEQMVPPEPGQLCDMRLASGIVVEARYE